MASSAPTSFKLTLKLGSTSATPPTLAAPIPAPPVIPVNPYHQQYPSTSKLDSVPPVLPSTPSVPVKQQRIVESTPKSSSGQSKEKRREKRQTEDDSEVTGGKYKALKKKFDDLLEVGFSSFLIIKVLVALGSLSGI